MRNAVGDYFDALARAGYALEAGRDPNMFEMGEDGRLQLKEYPDICLVNLRTGAPLALSTIGREPYSRAAIREMGFTEWRKPNMSQAAVEALQNGKDELGGIASFGALTSTSLDLRALGAVAQSAGEASGVAETTFTEVRDQLTDAEFDMVLQGQAGITLRELLGLVKVSQTTQGELTNNLAKVTELDKSIAMEK